MNPSVGKYWIQNIIMIKLDDLRPIFIGLAMSFKILSSTASRPIFSKLIALPINMGSINPILYQTCTQEPLSASSHMVKIACPLVKGHLGSKYSFMFSALMLPLTTVVTLS